MKNLTLAALLIAGASLTERPNVFSLTTLSENLQGKVAVRPEDLPEAVKSTLSSDGYADWKVTSAYLVTKENNAQYYEVNIKKGEETATLNVDKYGKKLD